MPFTPREAIGRPESSIHLRNASILSKSPIIILEEHDRITAASAPSAGISCGNDSAIAFSAIGTRLLDGIWGDYAAGIGMTANGTCSQLQFINGTDNTSSIRGAGIGAVCRPE
jgi:hypothetical protein